ncbi:hypothetical protein SAY87_011200 [Trapa incisa]|uniref:Uncharacterized protein n=1 Tax=Trapa incisa TaxID=236973 RepID=A0AAN7GQI4_9MYRT|nr:hypothetical protein SAY87_011200 [Trapa incisa]
MGRGKSLKKTIQPLTEIRFRGRHGARADRMDCKEAQHLIEDESCSWVPALSSAEIEIREAESIAPGPAPWIMSSTPSSTAAFRTIGSNEEVAS